MIVVLLLIVARLVLAKKWFLWPFQWLSYLLVSNETSPSEKIKYLSPIPLLVIHAINDPIVPIKCGLNIYNLGKDPKFLWKINSKSHIATYFIDRSKYKILLIKYLDTH